MPFWADSGPCHSVLTLGHAILGGHWAMPFWADIGPCHSGRTLGRAILGGHWAMPFWADTGPCHSGWVLLVQSDGSHKVTAACSTGDSRMFATENNVKSEEAGGCAHYSYGPAMYTCALLQTVCKHSAISNSLLTSPAMKTLLIMFRS